MEESTVFMNRELSWLQFNERVIMVPKTRLREKLE